MKTRNGIELKTTVLSEKRFKSSAFPQPVWTFLENGWQRYPVAKTISGICIFVPVPRFTTHTSLLMKKALWFLFVFGALVIGLYPIIYFLVDREFGLLSTKSPALLENTLWNIGFYTHIIGGGIALLCGWSQFSKRVRDRYLHWHRRLGKTYVVAVLLSGGSGLMIGFLATGGWIAASGFVGLALVWLYTTLSAYTHIRGARVAAHERMMMYSYAACFAAVTLRIWLPLLTIAFQDFVTAYRAVAWVCWVPNLVVARWLMLK